MIDKIIEKYTEYDIDRFTGGSIQISTAYEGRIINYKLLLFFGYNKSTRHPITATIPIRQDDISILLSEIDRKVNELSYENDVLSLDFECSRELSANTGDIALGKVEGKKVEGREVEHAPLHSAKVTPSNKDKKTSKTKPNMEYTEEFNNVWKNYTREFYNKASGRNDVRKIDTFKNFLNIMKHKFNLPANSSLTNYKIINFAIDDEITAYNESKKIPKALCNILKIDQLQELIDQNTGQ
jgi:hypothetical protein